MAGRGEHRQARDGGPYSRKKSYPAVRAFELAAGSDAQRLRAVYSQAVVSQGDALWVRELMTGLGLREEGAAKVEEYARRAGLA
ncbi:MAG: hypothetical protein WKH64_09045 [Chloroflexia bacterium]